MPSGRGGYRPQCSYDGCHKPHVAKGLCRSHYQRWRKTGDPEGGSRRVQCGDNLLDKVTQKFVRGVRKLANGCWTCDTAYRTVHGYLAVQITENGIQHAFKAHRFSYEHFVGKIPDEMLVCHKCDNPSCCNPRHLFLGSQSDNMRDMVAKCRGLVGAKNPNTKFSEDDILHIYECIDRGMSRKKIAEIYGVASVTISHIATGRNWTHLYKRHRRREPV